MFKCFWWDSWLWHRRLGHASFEHLARINSKELVKSIPCLKFEKYRICGVCQLEKQTKSSFKPIKDIMLSRPLELIHMDLFGPTTTKSLNENRYVFALVDDFSCFTWLFWSIKIKLFRILRFFERGLKKKKDFRFYG